MHLKVLKRLRLGNVFIAGLIVALLIYLIYWFVVRKQAAPVLTDDSLPETPPESNEMPQAVEPVAPKNISNWEEKVEEILRDNIGSGEKARRMLAVFPRLPEAGQIAAAKHISNLISDKDYPRLGRHLADAATPSKVTAELMTDLLNRPNRVKLPMLLEIARNPKHAKAGEAREILRLYLNGDYGDNWKLWGQKVAEWLRDNPDSENPVQPGAL